MKVLLMITAGLLSLVIFLYVTGNVSIAGRFIYFFWWRATTSSALVSGKIDSRGAHIHYRVYGRGAPVLLLHGGLSHRLVWFSQVPWLVNSGRQVILLDSRGHGESELGKIDLSYRLFANDVLLVLDRLGVRTTDIIGWSDGANTALMVARLWPRRVEKIVAISGNYDPSGIKPEARKDHRILLSGLRYWLYRWWTGAGDSFSELEKKIKQLWQNGPIMHSDDLRAINSHVLVIIGEHDLISLEHARQMAELLPDGKLEIIPGGGHVTPVTNASQVDSLIRDFLPGTRG